jgi:hypothetical protein
MNGTEGLVTDSSEQQATMGAFTSRGSLGVVVLHVPLHLPLLSRRWRVRRPDQQLAATARMPFSSRSHRSTY